eukprot:CAMPEP_0117621794 /NCGR_PEP_ID=MMETSP0784-20121206/87815_1 /TAXON_ID=39447 /ORGANISM="" /LENGTH=412 /DNA_ID=CAMNT_0005425725 /DNA_START=120 /DNA_END=1355 /DNA_ORIENTATION=+
MPETTAKDAASVRDTGSGLLGTLYEAGVYAAEAFAALCKDEQDDLPSSPKRGPPAQNASQDTSSNAGPCMSRGCLPTCSMRDASAKLFRRWVRRHHGPTHTAQADARSLSGSARTFLGARQCEHDRAVAAILDTESSGRILEALRLLDAYGTDGAVPSAGRIRQVAAAVDETLRNFERARASSRMPRSGWQEWNLPGVDLVYNYDWYTGGVELLADATLDFEPVRLWALFREFDLVPIWTNASTSVVLERFGNENEFYHVISAALMSLLSPTEVYTERNYIDLLDEHGVMLVLANTPPLEALEHCGVAIPKEASPVKRVVTHGRDMLMPVSPTRTRFVLYRKLVTPFPYLPSWAVGIAASIMVNDQMSKLYAARDKWEGGDHDQRMSSGSRALYYAAVHARLEAAMNSRSQA